MGLYRCPFFRKKNIDFKRFHEVYREKTVYIFHNKNKPPLDIIKPKKSDRSVFLFFIDQTAFFGAF